MPIPIPEALDAHADLSVAKANQARSAMGRYLVSSMLAGAFVGVAVVLLLATSAPLMSAGHPLTKLVQGGVFGVALTLVVFAGAELFTGNNMFMLQGMLKRKVGVAELSLVWGASLVGNLIGSVGFAAMVHASGIVTAGAPPGGQTVNEAALGAIALSKHNLTGGQLFFRAVLCNMLVCLAIWMAARAASDAAKLVCLWWALLAFIASGFEHSVANMTALSLAALSGVGTWGDLWGNLVFTVPGNIVGGGILVGLVYGWLGMPLGARAPRRRRIWVPVDDVPAVAEEVAVVVPATAVASAPPKARLAAKKAPTNGKAGTNGKTATNGKAATNGRTARPNGKSSTGARRVPAGATGRTR